MSDLIQQESLGTLVANKLRQSIWDRETKFGESLIESDLSERYGVSRSTVRDALKILENEGLVVIQPRKGSYVAEFSNEDWKEIIELRTIIESHAFIKAAEQLTDQHIDTLKSILNQMQEAATKGSWSKLFDLDMKFHGYIVQLSNNSRIKKIYKSIQVQIRTFLINLDQYYSSYESFYEEQKVLFNALLSKDPDHIQSTVEQHIGYVENRVLAELK